MVDGILARLAAAGGAVARAQLGVAAVLAATTASASAPA